MDEELTTSRRSTITFVVLLLVTLILLTAHLSGYVRTLKSFLFYVVSPAPETASRVIESGRSAGSDIADIVRVHEENFVLRRMLQRYAFLEDDFRRIREENERLRNLVAFPAQPGLRSVVAMVTLREPGSWFQSVMINKGKNSGIRADDPALTWIKGRPVVIGRVSEVYLNSAKIVLITNAMSAVPVELVSIDEDGLMEGQNGPVLRINYILPEGTIAIGDEVVTSPLSSVFPPGMLVGRVVDLVSTDDQNMRSAAVRPAANFNSLREMLILTGKNQERS